MAQIIKIGDNYYSDFRHNGKRIRRFLSPYKEQAETMLNDLMKIVKAEKTGEPVSGSGMSWFMFKEKYLRYSRIDKKLRTFRNDEYAFKMVETYGTTLTQLSQMTPTYLNDFRTRCIEKGMSKRTVSGYCRRMKTAMHWAEETDLIGLMKWKNVKCVKDRKRKDYLTYPQFQQVLAETEDHPHYHRATMILGFGGLRRGEILNLEWKDVDFRNHEIRVRANDDWSPKGSEDDDPKERDVPMTPTLETYLRKFRKPSGLVIGSPLDPDAFTRYYNRLGRRLKLHVFPHLFRHTCASFLISTGSTLKEVGAILGQEDLRSTDIYTHMLPDANRRTMNRMDAGLQNMKEEDDSQNNDDDQDNGDSDQDNNGQQPAFV